ncbi:MAG: hypothetical protein DRJ66_01770 [Thermoprotei archaeon]|nr:MAG: hypothetical protein DRJ66_01770 [Thermoprotei archaeon]RLF19514.1 MAG: hypothetical protein DRZ82_05430 [Thermoprotei archaeon]
MLPPELLEYFPYTKFRPKQDEVIKFIYENVKKRNNVLLQAMSGFGKTISLLTSLLPLIQSEGLRLVYLARTHKEHERVIEELRAISQKGKKVMALALRGRSEMCLVSEVARQDDYKTSLEICESLRKESLCKFYLNFLSRRKKYEELVEKINPTPFKAEDIISFARKENICPYEYAKLILRKSVVVACSYVYLFNSAVFPKFLKQLGSSLDELILVLDEAHNVPDIAMESLSDEISIETINNAILESKKYLMSNELTTYLKLLLSSLSKLESLMTFNETLIPKDLPLRIAKQALKLDFDFLVEVLKEAGEMVKEKRMAEGKLPRSAIARLASFLERWASSIDKDYMRYLLYREEGSKRTKIGIIALDPAPLVAPLIEESYCTIMASATLEPMDYYAKLLGLRDYVKINVSFQLEPWRILVLVTRGITTDYRKRKKSMYLKMVNRLREVIQETPGNVGIFAASYDIIKGILSAGFLDMVRELGKPVFIESPNMKSYENDLLIKGFKSYANKGGAVLLGVQGGRNAEGEDFPGNEMQTVVVLGIPFARPSPSVMEKVKYFNKKFPGKGRLFGYVLPAIKKACQAAGRPIRKPDDEGVIVLMDYRFLSKNCKDLLPKWIRSNIVIVDDKEGELERHIRSFWLKRNYRT